MLFDYKDDDIQSILQYANRLIGQSFNQIIDEWDKSAYKNYEEAHSLDAYKVADKPSAYGASYKDNNAKGNFGNIIEKNYFGYKPNSDQRPDFPKVGLELKQAPIDIKKDGSYRAGERLVITNIAFNKAVEDDFDRSHLWNKIQKILLIHYLRDRNLEDKYDNIIKYVNLFTPSKEDLEIIKQDYQTINNKIKAGQAHMLSEGDTMYLGACTKARNKEDVVPQYYGEHTLTKKRAFSLKQSYMNYVLHKLILNENEEERILKDDTKLTSTFESFITSKINSYIGKSESELFSIFPDVKSNKSKFADFAFRMLGVKSNQAEEFTKASIKVKSIRVEQNGRIRESMPFPNFEIMELIKEEWDSSTLYNTLSETKFLFVVYVNNGTEYILKGCFLWNMPIHDIDEIVKHEWENYINQFKLGVSFEVSGASVFNSLLGEKNTSIIHIRPHASKSAYLLNNGFHKGNIERHADQLPNGEWMTKQCFWINKKYLESIINSHIKDIK
ncbi:hypothetical protein A4S06_08815 [Erysipelotrichaceae bacterium MTC7]|nr:hypothetical protein A4S06_08815 [Erysipelotrichaceae bacterium MTC7]